MATLISKHTTTADLSQVLTRAVAWAPCSMEPEVWGEIIATTWPVPNKALGDSKNTSKAEVVLLVAGVAAAVGGAERMATAVATGPASEAALESLMGTASWEVVVCIKVAFRPLDLEGAEVLEVIREDGQTNGLEMRIRDCWLVTFIVFAISFRKVSYLFAGRGQIDSVA